MNGNTKQHKSIGSRIFRGATIIVAVGILAKITSLIVEAILAAYLGTTYKSDAYYMVASIQNVIYPMLSIGIWKVFLPLYKGHVAKGENELADGLTNKSLSFFTAISAAVMVLLFALAPLAVSVVAPGFKGETRELCIKLTRISSPMYVFIIAAAIYASVLQCHDRFLGSQIREVASHIPTIIAAVFFYKKFGIEAMAVALVAAAVLRLLIELPFVNWGYRFKPDFGFKTPEFVLMLKRLPSALISAGVAQLNTLVDKAMASTQPTGTISALNYGHKLMNVFSGLLSAAISTAMYPQMIELITLDKKKELASLVAKIVNIFCILMLPITLACVLFRSELVSAAFERGAFDHSSTLLTSSVFALYSLGLFFVACNTVISNIFYGHGDTRTPMIISCLNLVINVVLNLIFMKLWGVNGLALATSVSAMMTFFMRMKAAGKYITLHKRDMLVTAAKVLVSGAVACFVPRTLFWLVSANRYLVLIASAVIALPVYLVLIRLFRVRELSDLIALARKKLKRKA